MWDYVFVLISACDVVSLGAFDSRIKLKPLIVTYVGGYTTQLDWMKIHILNVLISFVYLRSYNGYD